MAVDPNRKAKAEGSTKKVIVLIRGNLLYTPKRNIHIILRLQRRIGKGQLLDGYNLLSTSLIASRDDVEAISLAV